MPEARARRWGSVGGVVVAIAAAAATLLAFREASRQRDSLVQAFVAERLGFFREEIHDVEGDLADARQHLEIASRGLLRADLPGEEEQALAEVLAVVRTFELMSIHAPDGSARITVLDRSTPPVQGESAFAAERSDLARVAMQSDELVISPPLGDPRIAHYRALAAPVHRRDGGLEAVVLLVNVMRQMDRMRISVGGPTSTLHIADRSGASLVYGAVGAAGAVEAGEPAREVRESLDRALAGQAGSVIVPPPAGRSLPEALVVYGPVQTELDASWGIAVVVPTTFLEEQERAIVLRTLALGGALVLVLAILATVVIVSARRTVRLRERLRAAEEIAAHAELSEKILENVPVGVLVLDDAGRVTSMNRSARGVVPAAALGQPLPRAFPAAAPEATGELLALVSRARAGGAAQASGTDTLALAGPGTHFAAFAVPLVHPAPEPRLLVVFEDVTEVRALAVQLLRAEKLATVGVLAAGFAHEVGTPLGVMRGRAEMLLSRAEAGGGEAASARIIVDEIDRISRVIRDLLDFSRAGPATSAVAVALDAVAGQVGDLLALEAQRRGVALEIAMTPHLPEVAADPDQLKQVLVNLLMNALDATARGGRVRLQARAEGRPPLVVVEVEDEGLGIPAEHRHRVFDPFFTTKKRGSGSGLGLAVVARIVRAHGAEIELDERTARGARFVLRWPLAAQPAGAREASA